jgi:hypothetical protein
MSAESTKKFEPPPWEREAFEELARKREAEAEAARAAAAAQTAADEEASKAAEALAELEALKAAKVAAPPAAAAPAPVGMPGAAVPGLVTAPKPASGAPVNRPAEEGPQPTGQPTPVGGAALAPEERTAPAGGELDHAHAAMLLDQLRTEEPPVAENLWQARAATAGLFGLVGVAIVIFGLVGVVRTAAAGPGAVVGGLMFVLFGGVFVGIGAWVLVQALRQRGE